jgi:Glycosyl transferase family 2
MQPSETSCPTVAALMVATVGDDPEQLRGSLESLFYQSLPPDQLVLVLDGRLNAAQQDIIARYRRDGRIGDVRVIPLDQPHGVLALNIGIDRCSTEWILLMRVGDEAPVDRVQVQLDYILRHRPVGPEVIGGWCEELFRGSCVRSSPITHDAVVQCLRWQNVLVYGSVIIRTETLRAVGGYRTKFERLEDWDLYVRIALAKVQFAVIPKVLVRVARDQDNRRGLRSLIVDMRFKKFCWISGFISFPQYALSLPGQAVFRLIFSSVLNRPARTQG